MIVASLARMRYFLRLPGQCVRPDGRKTLMNRSLKFCVRLNALTATVGAVNVVSSARIVVTMLVSAFANVAVSSAV